MSEFGHMGAYGFKHNTVWEKKTPRGTIKITESYVAGGEPQLWISTTIDHKYLNKGTKWDNGKYEFLDVCLSEQDMLDIKEILMGER